ncbi:MAG TPA: chemotaxis protein CheW [Nevskiaceae bacterium]|nr:chemotaxis protein CheW [Nevskiaceae bacterium]
MSLDLSRFHQTFFEESREGLDTMESALLKLDIGRADSEVINTIFRAAHSIKGGAATFGFSSVAEYTHGVETLLDQMRSGKRAVTQPDVDLLLRAVDVLRGLLAAASDGSPLDTQAIAASQAELKATLSGGAASAAAPAAAAATSAAGGRWHIRFAPHADLFASGNDPLLILRELSALGRMQAEIDERHLTKLREAQADECLLAWNITLEGGTRAEIDNVFAWVEGECELAVEAAPAQAAATAAAPPVAAAAAAPAKAVLSVIEGGKAEHKASESSIRVGTEKIDALINLVGELVITQAMLTQQASALDPVAHEKLLNGLSQLDRNTRMLQEAVMSTRMLPMDFVFSRFPRMARDLAAKLGKQVRLLTVGEATELDKGVIERIADPLTHLVRNSLDHGLEKADDRAAAGKDPCGTIKLSAAHQGGHIVIEISDDGRGLDRERILRKAREKNLPCSESMSDADVHQLIFAPGFSTAEVVTDVSGRGVGMDVVKKNIQALSGQVELSSRPGHGTTVTIRLPLTLAILDGMSVRVGEEIFIVPLNCVVESLQPAAGQVKSVAQSGQVVRVRNEYLPLVALHQVFNLPTQVRDARDGILVLLESEGKKIAALVDELVGQQQVVIKSLEANYRRVHGISGATILGDGRVALILDVADLVRGSSRAMAA